MPIDGIDPIDPIDGIDRIDSIDRIDNSDDFDGIDDTYDFFLGGWRVHRAITNHRQSLTGVFSGTATVAPCDRSAQIDLMTAEYREVGGLHMGTYRGAAHRRLRFLRQQDGAVVIAFDDGRPFARCDLRSGRCEATHLCGGDRYDITWQVRTRQVVAEEWRVRGPEKDYVAATLLWRLRPEDDRAA